MTEPQPPVPPSPDVRSLTVLEMGRILGEIQGATGALAVACAILSDNLSAFIWLPMFTADAVLRKHWPAMNDFQRRHVVATTILAYNEHAARLEQYLVSDNYTVPPPPWTHTDARETEQAASRLAETGLEDTDTPTERPKEPTPDEHTPAVQEADAPTADAVIPGDDIDITDTDAFRSDRNPDA